MKLLIRSLPVVLLLVSACQTTEPVSKSASTVADLKSLQREIVAGSGSIAAAAETLGTLAEEGGDMEAEYVAFSAAIDRVQAQRDRVRTIRANLAQRRQAFAAEWEQSLAGIENASLKKRAMERREAVVANFEKIDASFEKFRADFDPWLSDLLDLRAYLQFDLNPQGIDTVSKDVKSIQKRSGRMTEVLDEFAEDLGKLVQSIEAAKPAPAPQGAAGTGT